MVVPIRANKERRKFRPAPEPTRVSVFFLQRTKSADRSERESLTDQLKNLCDVQPKSSFNLTFYVDDDCSHNSSFSSTRNVIIVSNSLEEWLKMYEKVKAMEPRRIGGGIALGEETLSDEKRKNLETMTGGNLPLLLSAPMDNPCEMVTETLKQIDSVLIDQEISLAARKRENKEMLREQKSGKYEEEGRNIVTWVRVGWMYNFDKNRIEKEAERTVTLVDGDEVPLRKDFVDSDILLLVSTCPQKLLKMYDLAKVEWCQKKVALALVDCAFSKKQMKEFESHLDGHKPYYGWKFDLNSEIGDAFVHFRECENYELMTKDWCKAKIQEKRRRKSLERIEESRESDTDSAVSFDSVDEFPFIYQHYEDKDSSAEMDDSCDSEHDCTNCITAAEANKVFDESFFGIFGTKESIFIKMLEAVNHTEDWLQLVYENKLYSLIDDYIRKTSDPITAEFEQGFKRRALAHTEVVLRKLSAQNDDDKIQAQMEGLQEVSFCEEDLRSSLTIDQRPSPTNDSSAVSTEDSEGEDMDVAEQETGDGEEDIETGDGEEDLNSRPMSSSDHSSVLEKDKDRSRHYSSSDRSSVLVKDDRELDDVIEQGAVQEVFNYMFGPSDEGYTLQRGKIATVNNWLLKVFHWKHRTLLDNYVFQFGNKPAAEVKKEIQQEAYQFTAVVLRGVMRWDNKRKVHSVMRSLWNYILNVQVVTAANQLLSATNNSPEVRVDHEQEVVPDLEQKVAANGTHDTGKAKKVTKRKSSKDPEKVIKKGRRVDVEEKIAEINDDSNDSDAIAEDINNDSDDSDLCKSQ